MLIALHLILHNTSRYKIHGIATLIKL